MLELLELLESLEFLESFESLASLEPLQRTLWISQECIWITMGENTAMNYKEVPVLASNIQDI